MSDVAIPRQASTLVLLRDSAGGPEVLMIRRHDASSFAAGALVFPGGAVHDEDGVAAMRARCRGLDALTPPLAAAAVAAIRETFEECGVLLARHVGSGAPVGGAAHRALVERYQAAVARDAGAWLAMLEAEDLELACDQLVHYAHWITPASRPKRFDTQFFVAQAPADQDATHDKHEAVDAVWLRPADVIAGADDGRYRVVFATRMNVQLLSASATVADALSASRTRPIVPVSPRMETRDGRTFLCIPLEAGYGVDAVPADDIPRA